jgi:hypothetical protein
MAITYPNSGKIAILARMLANTVFSARLYLGTSAPIDRSLTVADIVEAFFPGYSPQTATGWLTPIINALFAAESTAAPVPFFCFGGASLQTVVGGYLVDQDGELLAIGPFSEPKDMEFAGDAFEWSPVITVASQFNN